MFSAFFSSLQLLYQKLHQSFHPPGLQRTFHKKKPKTENEIAFWKITNQENEVAKQIPHTIKN